jgi:hypothetical protein
MAKRNLNDSENRLVRLENPVGALQGAHHLVPDPRCLRLSLLRRVLSLQTRRRGIPNALILTTLAHFLVVVIVVFRNVIIIVIFGNVVVFPVGREMPSGRPVGALRG